MRLPFSLSRQACLGLLMTAASLPTFAANTQTFINNVSGLGNAFSGVTVVTDDASVQYYNPAGMAFVDGQQVALGMAVANSTKKFTGTTVLKPFSYSQTGTATANPFGFLPFVYYSLPINSQWFFGAGMSAFGGSGQIFSDNSIVRYSSTKTMVGIINISPAVAYKLNDMWAFGFGLDINYLTSVLNAMVPTGVPGTAPDAKSNNQATNFGYGWHAGGIFNITKLTRLGLAYRSQVNFYPNGTSTFVLNPGADLTTEYATPNFTFNASAAPTLSLGVSQKIKDKWKLLAGVDYSQWSIVRTIYFHNIAFPTGQVDTSSILNFKDTWRLSLGTHYQYNDKWMLRAGIFYDQDPTNHQYVSADGVPNTDCFFLAIGARYYLNSGNNVDIGYGHYFFTSLNIGYNTPQFQQVGTFRISNSNVLGLQFNIKV